MLKRPVPCTVLACLIAGALAPAATAATPPNVSTGPATGVAPQSATLTGTVNPRGRPAAYYFQYGTTTHYSSRTPQGTLSPTRSGVPVSAPLSGLTPSKTYHYRLVAYSQGAGTATGADRTFKTPALPVTASVTATPNPVPFGGPIVITGTLVNAPADSVVVLQANPFPYTAGFTDFGDPHVASATGGYTFPILVVPITTQFRVRTTGSHPVYSPVVTEGVSVVVNARARTWRRGRDTVARFTGDALPPVNGARVEVQKRKRGRWATFGRSTLRGSRGRSTFAVTIRFRAAGAFRVVVVAADGYHTTGYSGVIRLRPAR